MMHKQANQVDYEEDNGWIFLVQRYFQLYTLFHYLQILHEHISALFLSENKLKL